MSKMRLITLLSALLLLGCGSSASSETYYVAKSGHDRNTCLSLHQACLTIARASQLATRPGDVVRVGAGEFRERVKITSGGEEGAPITYTGQSGSACPTIAISDPNSRKQRPAPVTTLQGFTIEASHVTVDCFRIVGSSVTGVAGSGVYIESGLQGIRVADNVIDAGDTPGRPWAGVAMKPNVSPSQFSKDVTVTRNYIVNTGYGFMIYCGDNCLFSENEVEQLIAENGKGDNDYTRIFGENVTLFRNYFHGNRSEDCVGCHTDCFQSYNVGQIDNVARRILIDSNICFGAHQAFIVRDTSSKVLGQYTSHYDWTIRNNVVGFGPEGGTMPWCGLFDHVGSVVFEHNLCVQAGYTGYLNGSTGVHRYNIHMNTGWKPYGSDSNGEWQAGELAATGNLLYRNDGQYTQSQWPNDLINRQPLFSNWSRRDFRITSRSPARNAAQGSTVRSDQAGQQRPLESVNDIGPFEFRRSRPFPLSGEDGPGRKQ